jgi:hypothetical protein
MWYNIDINKFAFQLLPPVLRSRLILAIIKVLISPVVYCHQLLIDYRIAVERKFQTTSNVITLEKSLNDLFYLQNGAIYIGDGKIYDTIILYSASDVNMPSYVYAKTSSEKSYMKARGENISDADFYVYVPTFLCTSLIQSEDKYKGLYISKIINLINSYKPAGRKYSIKLYDYE